MMLAEWLPNLGLVLLALLFAWHAPDEQRRQALACWAVIAADWLVYVTSWTPFALHFALKAVGIGIPSEDIWPVVDAVAAALVVAIAYNRGWALVLWCCLAVQVCRHTAHQIFGGGFDPYTQFLDLFFWGQIACFLMIGGRGVGDVVAHNYRRLRNGLGAALATPARQARRRR